MEQELKEVTFEGRENIPKVLHPACKKCISWSREKYSDFTDETGIYYKDGFAGECPYIPPTETYFPGSLKLQMTPEEWKLANSFKSPLLWAEANLIEPDTGKPWRAWPHQRGPLLCLNPRKCYRFGRRCVTGETIVSLSNGEKRSIKNIRAGDIVLSLSEREEILSKKVLNFWENGKKEVFRIVFSNGKEVECTENHPFLLSNGTWLTIKEGLFPSAEVIALKESIHSVFIGSISSAGIKPTYDIEVEDTHNFIGNGIVLHNTGKTISLAIEILWFLFTSAGGVLKEPDSGKIRQNLKVLLLTPQKSHIENIFDRMRTFISLSPQLAQSIDRNKRGSPQVLSLHNINGGLGNIVSGYASGDSSGSKGLSARGQDADLVVLDEGAYISEGVIANVINPILYTHETTRLVVSSTPSGISGDYFERICTRKPTFVEFYVPASERPDWEEVEPKVRQDFGNSQEEWDKEVMAMFSPAGIGVYREDLVKLAQEEFTYGIMKYNPALVYTFGVDWNKEHGTEIVVVGTQRNMPHVSFLVLAENIPKKEFSTLAGVERIIELNRMWNPNYIYVDAGGGDGGQMLRHHGLMSVGKNPIDARLKDISKTFDFGSKIEISERNGKRTKVPAKPFMVNNSVRKMELGELKYPRIDLLLTNQMNNYVVVRRTGSGVPVYGLSEKKWGDHRLDALNLALIAIRLEFPSFTTEGVPFLTDPIKYVPPARKISSPRIMLPASTGRNRTPVRRDITGRGETSVNVVKCWNNTPGANPYDRSGLSIRRRFGR